MRFAGGGFGGFLGAAGLAAVLGGCGLWRRLWRLRLCDGGLGGGGFGASGLCCGGFGGGSFGGFGGGCFGLLAEGVEDDAEHLLFGGGFAGEDFELARALLHEHLDAGDDGDALLAGHVDERRLQRVVDEVEDEAGVEVLGFEDGAAPCCRPCRRAWR